MFGGTYICEVLGVILLLPAAFSLTDFKRVRQEIEVDNEGVTHVFLRVLDYNSSFELLLQKDGDNVFADNHVLTIGKEEIPVSTDFMVKGLVKGYPSSTVFGSIHENAFQGEIRLTPDLSYYVENGRQLFGRDFCNDNFRFCYIIYDTKSATDEKDRIKRSSDDHNLGMCGWNSKRVRDALLVGQLEDLHPNYPPNIPDPHHSRRKRDTQQTTNLKVCGVFMQADPKLWDIFLNDYNGDESKARSQLLLYFGQIIEGVNQIYKQTSFVSNDGSLGPFQNFQFKILRTTIYANKTICAPGNAGAVTSQLCRDNLDSAEFLSINSQLNHDLYCLAYLMTHRQFSEGVQGLAWIGYPKSYAGGVCQRNAQINGKSSSYNTGIVTSNNYGKRSPMSSLILTFAHEIGHNFGSPHDSSSDCTPGGGNGNYIMYPYVNPGNQANNKQFSSCSKNSIATNVNAVVNQLTSNKYNCFTGDNTPFCGNGIVEGNEVCDCGFADDCAAAGDNCCNPAGSSSGCQLKQGVQCSPSDGPCCDANSCLLLSDGVASATQCRPATECSSSAYCTSSSAVCPASSSKSDGTLCWDNSRVCLSGECSQSLCSLVKSASSQPYSSCQESIPDGDTNFQRYCNLACQAPSGSVCLNSANVIQTPSTDQNFYSFLITFGNLSSSGGKALQLGSGSPCNNYKGFCDVFHKCRNVNSQGPLASLFSLLTGDQAPQTAAQWLVTYWYVVAIVAVVFVAICLLLTQIFARNCIPSSNPKKHGRRSLRESLHRTMCCKTSATAKVSSEQQ